MPFLETRIDSAGFCWHPATKDIAKTAVINKTELRFKKRNVDINIKVKLITFLCIFALVHNRLAAMLAELLQLLFDLVVTLLIISRDVVSGITFRAKPSTKLTFTSCHIFN
jgi:hypothetical protein